MVIATHAETATPVDVDTEPARIEGWRRRTSALAWACDVWIHVPAERDDR